MNPVRTVNKKPSAFPSTSAILLAYFMTTPAWALDTYFTGLNSTMPNPSMNPPQLKPGESIKTQLCMTKQVATLVKSKIWPGSPISVVYNWKWVSYIQTYGYAPWKGESPALPLNGVMSGPLADGIYCHDISIQWSDFPSSGKWKVEAKIPILQNSSLGIAVGYVQVMPAAAKPVFDGPLKSTSQLTPQSPASRAGKAGTGGFAPVAPGSPDVSNANKPVSALPLPVMKHTPRQTPKSSSAATVHSGNTTVTHLPATPAGQVENAPGPPDLPTGQRQLK